MQQFAPAFRLTSSALVPYPLLHPSFHVSTPRKDHLKISGVMLRAKIALSYAPYLRTSVRGNVSTPLFLIASSVATRNLTMLKGTAPCGSTVGGASASTTLMTTAPPPTSNASKIPALCLSGTQWWAMHAQLPSKTTHMS